MSMSDLGTVIVTGGSRGLGAAISRKLGALGYAVAVNYASNAAAAGAVVDSITASGGRAAAIAADVADEEAVARLFAEAEAALGPITGLVNSAGIVGGSTRFADLDSDVLHRTFAVNVMGTMYCAREAVRRWSTARGGKGGAMVNFSSAAARLGGPGELVHYAASKGAIESFTLGLGREVAAEGIRVNAIAPGLIDTEMNPPERLARLIPVVPIRRAGHPDEVAEAAAWLLSDAASYITGTILTVSGGR
jgi:NAD(P)-dependent dehydrogenase (short-subunit alcohol dehydrogenase family)